MSEQEPVTFRGVCNFWFETGTEGAYWSFQDERSMGKRSDHLVKCVYCGLYWDKKRAPDAPPAPLDLRKIKKGDRCYLVNSVTRQRACKKHEWVLMYPNGSWSYDGLHILRDGDLLTIFDHDDRSPILWSGTILFDPPYVGGAHLRLSVKCFQSNIDHEQWKTWFTDEYPAALTLGPASLAEWKVLCKKKIEHDLK